MGRKSELYLLEPAPPLGEDDGPAGLVALLIRAEERLDRRTEAAALLHQHKPNLSFISVIPIDSIFYHPRIVHFLCIFCRHLASPLEKSERVSIKTHTVNK